MDKSRTRLDTSNLAMSLVSKNPSNIEEKELKRCSHYGGKHPSGKEKYFYLYLEL